MPRRLKAPRPSQSTYYPSQQNTASSAFGSDRNTVRHPRVGQ